VSSPPPPPGWWRASDGNWYPPQGPPIFGQPNTNGLAVASLVLSLLWIGGIGSILAVIFSITGRRRIKASNGRETGEGLATAGLVIGLIGMVGGALIIILFVIVGTVISNVTRAVVVPVGHSVNVPTFEGDGINKITVSSVDYPYTFGAPATPGDEYAVANVELCAGSTGSNTGPNPQGFELVFENGQSVSASYVNAEGPPLSDAPIYAYSCSSGIVTFEFAQGLTPASVRYDPLGYFKGYEWTIK
jgi:hypothetical protein